MAPAIFTPSSLKWECTNRLPGFGHAISDQQSYTIWRLEWPLHKDDTLSWSGRSMDLNIYFILNIYSDNYPFFEQIKTLNHNTRLLQRVFLRLSVGLKLIIYVTNAWGIITQCHHLELVVKHKHKPTENQTQIFADHGHVVFK